MHNTPISVLKANLNLGSLHKEYKFISYYLIDQHQDGLEDLAAIMKGTRRSQCQRPSGKAVLRMCTIRWFSTLCGKAKLM